VQNGYAGLKPAREKYRVRTLRHGCKGFDATELFQRPSIKYRSQAVAARLVNHMLPAGRVVCSSLVLLWAASALEAQGPARVQAIRFWSFGDITRIAVQTQGEYKLHYDQVSSPPRIYFDLTGLRPPASAHRGIQTIEVHDQRVRQIRIAEVSPGTTRIVFDLETPVEVLSSQLVNPDRLMIELRPKGTALAGLSIVHSVTRSEKVDLSHAPDAPPGAAEAISYPKVSVPAGAEKPAVTVAPITDKTVLPPPPPAEPVAHKQAAALPAAPAKTSLTVGGAALAGTTEAALNEDGSLVRVFGLKISKIVIDAGHGGHDTGTIGPDGLMEKDLVLDVALRLGKLISRRMGAEVVYTRSSDVFIPLQERTKIANEAKADLFISIHANSSPERSATGVETYYFNLTSDKHGLDLASRENASSTSSISDLNDLLHRAVLQAKLDESREFAQYVQTCLWAMSAKMNSRARDRGVRHAPFVVLIGATMPSILAEVGFVSNPHDERLMRRGEQRQRIAEALYKGISQYASSLNHVQVARAAP
jgi:N-acetylmuramoyl-L-alanine amidase